jgi:hypothetical protein
MLVMKLGMVLLGAAVLTGCGVSLQPFFTAANLYDDPSLEGLWSDSDSTWQIKHSAFAQYTIASCDDTGKCTADTDATLFRIGGQLYLDFQEKSSIFSDAIHPHGLFQINQSGADLEVSLLDIDQLRDRAKDHRLPVDHLLLGDRLLLTAPPEQLQTVLTFSEPHLITRH